MILGMGLNIAAPHNEHAAKIVTPEAVAFLLGLEREFGALRRGLLARREQVATQIKSGQALDFLPHTAHMRTQDWQVAPAPPDLLDRRTEITGPTTRKMIVNALNSGAKVFMADLEDSLSPSWHNVVDGQQNLFDAVRRQLDFTSEEGKRYALHAQTATLLVRPRGWHLEERHVLVDDAPMSASLFDFGLYFFHNAKELLARGSGPYFYLPKIESHLEAKLWNDVFCFAQDYMGIARGSIRATMLIETILAAFEMEEMLFELRDHASGLNAGRWDYIFSCIKKFAHSNTVFPDRAQITMTAPFMRAYTEQLVRTCHKRGAHAIGGMSAFIPNRHDVRVTERAVAQVQQDKERESNDGFDGTWVAHPDLVPVAMAVFDKVLGGRPHQKDKLRQDVVPNAQALQDFVVPNTGVSEQGVRNNISVGLRYIAAWLGGNGAVAIDNLMEDAATAEISRAQLWQWVGKGVTLPDGRRVDAALYARFKNEELGKLVGTPKLEDAATLLDALVLQPKFEEFLTVCAYDHLV